MIYFISDAHLGSLLVPDSHAHQRRLVALLDRMKADATAIYLLGDMFDFWYEYRTVVPKGFVRFMGKLAELTDSGVEVHFFTGNHDIWTFGYLEKELGLIVHRQPEELQLGDKRFFLAHGDGLNNDDRSFTILRKIFHSQTAQRMFRYFPPQWGQSFGYNWSKNNRLKHGDVKFKGEDKEDLVVFAKKYIETHNVDFLVFGHRHIPLDLQLSPNKRVIILGDYVSIFSYGVFDGQDFWLEYEE